MSAIPSIESCVWCNLQKQNERKLQTIFGKTVVRCGLRQVLYGSLIFFCKKTGVISLENGQLTLIQILKLTNKVYRNVRVCNVLRCPWGSPRFDWFKVLHSAAGQFGLCMFMLLPSTSMFSGRRAVPILYRGHAHQGVLWIEMWHTPCLSAQCPWPFYVALMLDPMQEWQGLSDQLAPI